MKFYAHLHGILISRIVTGKDHLNFFCPIIAEFFAQNVQSGLTCNRANETQDAKNSFILLNFVQRLNECASFEM